MRKGLSEAGSGIRLQEQPQCCPGGYSLHLYCKYVNPAHSFHEFPWEICQVETGAEARREARASGWILHRDGTATCPKCAKALAAGREALSKHGEQGR